MSRTRQRRAEPSQSIPHAVHKDLSTTAGRALRPRATDGISVAAIFVSDRTAPSLCGLESRVFRALVAKLGIPSIRIGKRLLVRAADLEGAIGSAEAAQSDPVVEARGPSREEILRRVGAVTASKTTLPLRDRSAT